MILIDTREKKNDNITSYFDKHKIPYEDITMSNGDYSFKLPANPELGIMRDEHFCDEIFIEKKNSPEELSGNFAQNRTRFEEEFSISKAKRKYLLIENCSYHDIVKGNYDTKYHSKSYLGSLHSFNSKYNLEVVFMPDNSYTPIFIYATFQYYLRNILK